MADPTLVTNPDLTAAVTANNVLLTQLVSFIQHGTLGGSSAVVIQWLKTRPSLARYWAILSDRGKVWLGAFVAAMGSLGVSATMEPSARRHGRLYVRHLGRDGRVHRRASLELRAKLVDAAVQLSDRHQTETRDGRAADSRSARATSRTCGRGRSASVMTRLRSRALVLVLALSAIVGCASVTPRHVATGGITAFTDALQAIQQAADGATSAGLMTAANRQKLATHLLPAMEAGRDVNTAILQWAPGSPMPTNIKTLIANVQGLTSDVAGAVTNPTTQAQVNAYAAAASSALLTILAAAQ